MEAGVSNKYQLRDEMNILYFIDLEKSMPAWPWTFKKEEKKDPMQIAFEILHRKIAIYA